MHGFFLYRGCARRARGGHFGGFGAGFGHGTGLGGRGFFGGRKLGSGELQLVILALLEERPRHGYEIIKALEDTSKGFYAPSPGMVYPALTYLEEVGYATVEAEGSKKLYRITDAGLTAMTGIGLLLIMYMSCDAWNSARALTSTADTSHADFGRSRWIVPSGSRW